MNRRLLGHSNKCGFMLSNLLVVIAAMAIIAAILFPVFASNLKRMGFAVLQYAQEVPGRK